MDAFIVKVIGNRATAFITLFSFTVMDLVRTVFGGLGNRIAYTTVTYHADVISRVLWVAYSSALYARDGHYNVCVRVISNACLFLMGIYSMSLGLMKHFCIILVEISAILLLLAPLAMAMNSNDPTQIVSIACATGSTLMCLVKVVCEIKRAECAPFLESLGSFASGAVWVIYGLISSDIFVLVPNVAWVLLGLFQLVRYAVLYRSASALPQIDQYCSINGRYVVLLDDNGNTKGIAYIIYYME